MAEFMRIGYMWLMQVKYLVRQRQAANAIVNKLTNTPSSNIDSSMSCKL